MSSQYCQPKITHTHYRSVGWEIFFDRTFLSISHFPDAYYMLLSSNHPTTKTTMIIP